MTFIVVLILRIAIPLSIFRFPFWGGIASLVIDLLDFVIYQRLGWGVLAGKGWYQEIDKVLDMYYLSIEFWVSMRWREGALRAWSLGTFLWRLIGFILFEITHVEKSLLIFPNIFENLFLLVAGIKKFASRVSLSHARTAFIIFFIALILKLPIEYHLHVHFIEPFQTWMDMYINRYLW